MKFSDIVVVSMKGYIGDAVCAAPLLSDLESQCTVRLLAPPQVGEVLGRSWDDRLIPLVRPRGVSSLIEQFRALRRLRPRTVLLVNRSFRSALAACLAGVPRRIGHATEGRQKLLTQALPYNADRPESKCYRDLAVLAGLTVTDLRARLEVDERQRTQGALLAKGGQIAIQPGARYAEKRIPIQVISEVARELGRTNRLVLVGGPEEREVVGLLDIDKATIASDLVGHCSLREMAGVFSCLDLAIGSDTGLMHLAAGVGCPTVTVFGPNPASKWGHNYEPHRIIEGQGGSLSAVTAAEILRETSVRRSTAAAESYRDRVPLL